MSTSTASSRPGEDTDRYSTEILLVPGGKVQFLERPNGNGVPVATDPSMASGDAGMQDNGAAPQTADSEDIPF